LPENVTNIPDTQDAVGQQCMSLSRSLKLVAKSSGAIGDEEATAKLSRE